MHPGETPLPRPVLAVGLALALAFGLTAFSDPALGDYRLAPADKVRIEVFGEPALGGDFALDGRGRITLPLVGEIQASGLSAPQLQAAVADALGQGYLNQPRVAAQVLTYRPFYILGEGNRPGEYPYASDLTALQAVATAQGVGASVSATLAGLIIVSAGYSTAFLALAAIAGLGFVLYLTLMPETRGGEAASGTPDSGSGLPPAVPAAV